MPMEGLPDETQAALDEVLDPTERVDDVASAVGSALVLTDRRLIVVRDGASYRSASGIRSFALDRDLRVRIEPRRMRVIIESAGATISLFIRSQHLERVETLLAEIRRRLYRL